MFSVLLLTAALCTAALDDNRLQPIETPELKAVDKLVVEGMESRQYPGAVLVIGRPGEVLWAKAYGRFTYDISSPGMKLDTLFDMASISKVMGTTTAAMLLMEQGRLKPEDRVASVLPSFSAKGKEGITLRDLLTHVSGLKAYEDRTKVEKQRQPGETHADALQRDYAELPLAYPTGTKHVYSCLNLQVMARVTETVLGRRMEDELKAKVWDRLGMSDTRYVLTREQISRTAPTMAKPDGTPISGETHDPLANYHGAEDHCPGNAGLFSNAPDMVRYAEMILGGGERKGVRIYKPETVALMTSVQTPPSISDLRGLGWDIYQTPPWCTTINSSDGRRVIGHTGYTGTWLWIDQHSRTYIIFLTNRVFPSPATNGGEGKDITPIRRGIADVVLKSRPEYREHFSVKTSGVKR